MKLYFLVFFLAAFALSIIADDAGKDIFTTNTFVEVEIIGSRISVTPDSSDMALLIDAPTVSLRSQSPFGALKDISINSSSYSEAGVMVNGLPLRNPHTEHFNADVFFPVSWVARTGVESGIGLAARSSGHPAASLAWELDAPEFSGGAWSAGGGTGGLIFGRIDDVEVFRISDSIRGFAGAFVSSKRADRIDGYRDNSLDCISSGGRVGAAGEKWQTDLLVSGFWREAGVRGAYGANDLYPADEEDSGGVLLGGWKYADEGVQSEITAAWSTQHDVYQMENAGGVFYRNRHTSDAIAAHGHLYRLFDDAFFADFRSDTFIDVIRSSSLGDESRAQQSIAAVPGFNLGRWKFRAGPALDLFSDFGAHWSVAGGAAREIGECGWMELSYREGCRQPSFTELNYKSPDSLGNAGLPLQTTRTLALDLMRRNGDEKNGLPPSDRIGLFYACSSHLVDWLKSAGNAKWMASDLGRVDIVGANALFNLPVNDVWGFRFDGLAARKFSSARYYSSRYAMDYPKVGAGGMVKCAFSDDLSMSYRQGLECWASNPVRRGGKLRNVSNLELSYKLPLRSYYGLNIGACDLFNQAFEVFPGQKASGFAGYLSLVHRW